MVAGAVAAGAVGAGVVDMEDVDCVADAVEPLSVVAQPVIKVKAQTVAHTVRV